MLNEILKQLRMSRGLSAGEAARDLSITPQHLSRIENGHQTPSAILIERMITEYEAPPEDAEVLRVLAGYAPAPTRNLPTVSRATSSGPSTQVEQLSNIEFPAPKDVNPVLYTNALLISSDNFGIVIDVGQKTGASDKVRIVSRVGLSLPHAEQLYDALGTHIKKLKSTTEN